MTISWTFYNTPKENECFEAELNPSVGDHIFQFNLVVHASGSDVWSKASQDFAPGNQSGGLRIRGRRDQDLLLLIKDEKGTEKRIKYTVDNYWVDGGDVGTMQWVSNYRKHFVSSLGISEEQMYCRALFEEYHELEAKTTLVAQDMNIRTGEITKPHYITRTSTQDLIRRKIFAKELVKQCKDYFNDKFDEWHDLELDAKE